MISSKDYLQKLKDPRWQKRRLDILQRDKWTCQKCSDTKSTLSVHHKHYIEGKEPWDYPNELLITLCDDCHEGETANYKNNVESIMYALRSKFLSEDISNISMGFYLMELQNQPSVVADAIGWALADKNIQTFILDMYFDYLHNKSKEITNGKV